MSYDGSAKTITISTSVLTDVGVYNLRVVGSITDFPSITESSDFSAEVYADCNT